jgi:hypothetical protein
VLRVLLRSVHFRVSSRFRARFLSWIVAFSVPALLSLGCSGTSTTVSRALYAPYLVSRDGMLRYRIPAGWFTAVTDSSEPEKLVFLVRNDYAGSLTVNEVHLDGSARRQLEAGGLLPFAQLTASLEASSKSGIVVSAPVIIQVNGKEACTYELEFRGNGDRVRTVLVDTGHRVYSVAALVNGSTGSGAAGEILTAQQAFVSALRW